MAPWRTIPVHSNVRIAHRFCCSCALFAVSVQVLDSSPYKWLHELLECFNHGDLHQYDALCAKHAAVLNAQPALVENERRLREKVCAQMGLLKRLNTVCACWVSSADTLRPAPVTASTLWQRAGITWDKVLGGC
jgi:hypothetical protein